MKTLSDSLRTAYHTPVIQLIKLNSADIITSSVPFSEEPDSKERLPKDYL